MCLRQVRRKKDLLLLVTVRWAEGVQTHQDAPEWIVPDLSNQLG